MREQVDSVQNMCIEAERDQALVLFCAFWKCSITTLDSKFYVSEGIIIIGVPFEVAICRPILEYTMNSSVFV